MKNAVEGDVCRMREEEWSPHEEGVHLALFLLRWGWTSEVGEDQTGEEEPRSVGEEPRNGEGEGPTNGEVEGPIEPETRS
jgi:hypothetical protein